MVFAAHARVYAEVSNRRQVEKKDEARENADGGATRARWAPVQPPARRNVVSCEPIETVIPKIDPSTEITGRIGEFLMASRRKTG